MFTDGRSKSILFIAHCILNQNSKMDGSASYPGGIKEILELLSGSDVGIVQMPCPEFTCLGLDRDNAGGTTIPIAEENTRIRKMMLQNSPVDKMNPLIQNLIYQISEYQKNGFKILGIVGVNRSPTCGVETTSDNNQEVEGEGVFIGALRKELENNEIQLKIVGIKAFEPDNAVKVVKNLIEGS